MTAAWYSRLTPDYWEQAGKPEIWLNGLGDLLGAIVTLLSVGIAAYLTYRFTRKHSALTHNTQIRVERLRHKIRALEAVWSLLAYMSQQRSDKAIIRWRKSNKNGAKKVYDYHFPSLAHFYLEAVSDVFYAQHAGLHLPNEVRDLLYQYVHAIAPLYYAHIRNGKNGDLVPISNPEIAEKLHQIYQQLNRCLKEELGKTYDDLGVT